MMLEGEIHIDGKYAGGHIKPENRKVDRRCAENQNFKRLTTISAAYQSKYRPVSAEVSRRRPRQCLVEHSPEQQAVVDTAIILTPGAGQPPSRTHLGRWTKSG
ncbi:hypothetical protein ACIQUB_30800 [Rhizobium sp. NPDC090275]|uniref:hypothetical protein n=1 Tax=Rhizobium sp. NPDC090275 TaxID=3364498 RepID=UPI00383AB8E9